MATYSKTIDKSLFIHYRDLLKNEDCVFSIPQYTVFKAKACDWEITFYNSGKVVVQGKNIDYIVQKYFEKDFKTDCKSTATDGEIAPYPHIGIDESGKGDFFGPLIVAGCYLNKENAELLKEKGAMDSKKLDDKKILALSNIIKENSIYDVVVVGNKKYNEIYSKFKNLNRLLAWGHATVLENLLLKTDCKIGISDKFGDEKFIQSALKEKGKQIELIQRPKAEADTAVACASIIARAEFVKRIAKMSADYEMDFPKGAGENVLIQGKKFIEKYGADELINVSKTHFKTYQDVCNYQAKLF